MKISWLKIQKLIATATLACALLLPFQADAHRQFERRTPLVIAVEKVGPAVVNIHTEEAPRQARNPFRGFFGDELFKKYFKDFPRLIVAENVALGPAFSLILAGTSSPTNMLSPAPRESKSP